MALSLSGYETITALIPQFTTLYKKYVVIKSEFTYKTDNCTFASNGTEAEIYKNSILIGTIKNNLINIKDGNYSIENNIVHINGITLDVVLKNRFNIIYEIKPNANKIKDIQTDLVIEWNDKYSNILYFSIANTKKFIKYNLESGQNIGTFNENLSLTPSDEIIANSFAGIQKEYRYSGIFNNLVVRDNCIKDGDYYYLIIYGVGFEHMTFNRLFFEPNKFIVKHNGIIIFSYYSNVNNVNIKSKHNSFTSKKGHETMLQLMQKYDKMIKNPEWAFYQNGSIRYDGSKYYTLDGMHFELPLQGYNAIKHLSDDQIKLNFFNIQPAKLTPSGGTKRARY